MPESYLEIEDKIQLYEDIFPPGDIPRIVWDFKSVPMDLPDEIYITDTTFRDGQQAREPYTVNQMVTLFDLLHRLGGPKGIIKWSEFFPYTNRDRAAIKEIRERGFEYPKVTGWMRARKEDLQLIKEMKLEETGVLTSISDYHIRYKFGLSRNQIIEKYLEICEEALKSGISVRCHLEDVTRADFYGMVVPFVKRLIRLEEKYNLPVKVRLSDTLGLGLPYPEAALPRSIPKMVHGLIHDVGLPHDRLEFHGHNDLHKGVINATTAWLYGCTYNNCTLLSIGERSGNTPLEAMVIEYIQLKGTSNGMNTKVISEIADFYEKIGYKIPPYYPLVGKNFTVTGAGIHADGMLKAPEIYLPFDTEKILGKPPKVAITPYSGVAGIILWICQRFGLIGNERISKDDQRVKAIYKWVEEQYSKGRMTAISDKEMEKQVRKHFPELIRR
ncbi:MAG: 2-isopropylmalate synthase [Nitrososphaerales archaeon]